MIDGVIDSRRASGQCLGAVICLVSLGATVLGQSPTASDASKAASTPSAPKPESVPGPKTTRASLGKPATIADSKPAPSPPVTMTDSSVEDRLRRMEDAYRRIEEANKKIQGQYDGLLKKYDELKTQLKSDRGVKTGRTASATTRPASRVGAVEYQESPVQAAQEGIGARGMGGRTAPPEGGRKICRVRASLERAADSPPRRAKLLRRTRRRSAAVQRRALEHAGRGDEPIRASPHTVVRRRCLGVSARSSSPKDWKSHPLTMSSN